ncbi:MAG: diguanylate cyclase [Sulfuricurvum sp.]|nr:diguanylate cyclase [Sulfuricurvum sp.]
MNADTLSFPKIEIDQIVNSSNLGGIQFINYMISNISNLIFVADRNNRFVYVNDAVLKKYQYTREELLNMSIGDIDIHFDVSVLDDAFWQEFANKKVVQIHSIHKAKDWSLYPVLINSHYLEYEGDAYNFGIVEDQSYIQQLINTQEDFVVLTDGTKLVMANSKMLNFFGYKDFITFISEHKCICEFFLEEDGYIHNEPTWVTQVAKSRHSNAKVKIENPITNEEHIFLVRASAFENYRFVVTFTNITYEEKYKTALEHLAITDAMTQLFNRGYFNKIMPREINRAKRNKSQIAFIMLDVDFFKLYNDTYGHQNGDEVLVSVASTIQKYFNRASDFCFRLGGEEFGVICAVDSIDDVYQQTEELRIAIEDLHIEHEQNSASNYVTVSIGISICGGLGSLETLYSQTDAELYRAKGSGRNKVCMTLQVV